MSWCILIQCLVMYVVFLLACTTNDLFMSRTKQLQNVTKDTYVLRDQWFDREERLFFDQPNNVALLRAFYAWLTSQDAFDYFIGSSQYASMPDRTDIPAWFEIGYDIGRDTNHTLNSLQVDAAFLKHFDISVGGVCLKNRIISFPVIKKSPFCSAASLAPILNWAMKSVSIMSEKFWIAMLPDFSHRTVTTTRRMICSL